MDPSRSRVSSTEPVASLTVYTAVSHITLTPVWEVRERGRVGEGGGRERESGGGGKERVSWGLAGFRVGADLQTTPLWFSPCNQHWYTNCHCPVSAL